MASKQRPTTVAKRAWTAAVGFVHCLRCGHDWYPQRPTRPAVCPRCKSYRWEDAQKGERDA